MSDEVVEHARSLLARWMSQPTLDFDDPTSGDALRAETEQWLRMTEPRPSFSE